MHAALFLRWVLAAAEAESSAEPSHFLRIWSIMARIRGLSSSSRMVSCAAVRCL